MTFFSVVLANDLTIEILMLDIFYHNKSLLPIYAITPVWSSGQIWTPASAYKTAEVISNFNHEGLPLIFIANIRGFSGGQKGRSFVQYIVILYNTKIKINQNYKINNFDCKI